MTDENGQAVVFEGIPDAPQPEPIGKSFLTAVGKTLADAGEAMRERQRLDAIEAEEAAEEAARLAHIAEAAETLGDYMPDSELADAPAEPHEERGRPDNVVPLQRRAKTAAKKDGRGEFFAIDHRLWPKVCALGMNEAIAYLVLARGTGGDNRTSFWSVNAIEQRTNISRDKAKKAVLSLRLAGLIEKDGSPRRPQYRIEPMSKAGADIKSDLSTDEEKMLSAFRGEKADGFEAIIDVPETAPAGQFNSWMGIRKPRQAAFALARQGLLEHINQGWFKLTKKGALTTDESDWTWLPNLLVDPMDGAPAPIERIRQGQFVPALQLFIDMYHAHDLRGGKGVDWRAGAGIRTVFERHKVGENSVYVIWGFKLVHTRVWPDGPLAKPHLNPGKSHLDTFWQALKILTNAGLVGDVPHLIEVDDYLDKDMEGDRPKRTASTGEIIHPLPHGWRSRGLAHPDEAAITAAAEAACKAMVSPGQWTAAINKGAHLFAPVKATIEDVALVGIYRLRHAPKTSATRDWASDAEEWRAYVSTYNEMAGITPAAGAGASAISRRDQG